MYEVRVYTTRDGKDMFAAWLHALRDVKVQRAVLRRRDRMAEGNFGDHKSCGGGIWELRIDMGPGYRIYYALASLRVVLLLLGGDKTSQASDIARAKDCWQDWKERA